MDYDWFEVWAGPGSTYPYVLLVLQVSGDSHELVIIDPKELDRVVFRSSTYDEVRDWLLEDEFTRVEGREEEP